MKKHMIALVLSAISTQAFASTKLTCRPSKNNSYFTEEVSLSVLSKKSIKVNNVTLKEDVTYKPKTLITYKRYLGKTAMAADWSDSGSVEILYDGGKRLKFSVRGEVYISETFTCSEAR